MSNAVATISKPIGRSVLIDMAMRFGMEPQAFEATVRATCIQKASREEFAAFLLVAKEYGLNPLTKEIYAFPAKGGGIVPVVSIDGWINLVNSHGACDGFEFEMEHADDGSLISCTCRMYRKDRGRPVTVTEYLSECKRGTDPWKMQHRMLRHKAMIQAARYAFGFSGIYDEDEGAKIADVSDASREEPPAPPAPALAYPVAVASQQKAEDPVPEVGDLTLEWIEQACAILSDPADLEEMWNAKISPRLDDLLPPDQEEAMGIYRKHEQRLAP
jgi:phage recombination protein Bet